MFRLSSLRVVPAMLLLPFAIGCAGSFTSSPSVGPANSFALKGTVFGGTQPISGAAVYMYAASATGYGTASTSLLTTGSPGVTDDGSGKGTGYVTTSSTGSFTIKSDFTCPSPSSLIYLVARGGNPGFGGTNSAVAVATAVGACNTITSATTIRINELTTVAAVTALAPFANAAMTSVATSPTNVAGLTTAFVTANNIVSSSTGAVNPATPSGLGAIPVNEINALADVLASCINSTGVGGNCSTLFTATKPAGGSAPTDTVAAMYQIATHPAQNVSTLYGLVGPTPPYTPATLNVINPYLGSQQAGPTDWTVAITYTSGSLTGNPFRGINYLALDSKSNVWTVSNGHAVQMSPTGDVNFNLADIRLDTNNYNQALAVDLDDSLWFDENSYSVGKITKAGAFVCSLSGYSYCSMPGAGTNAASVLGGTVYLRGYGGIAIHPATNHAWAGSASNDASAMVEIDTNEVGLATYTEGNIINPTSVAVDTSGNLWFPSEKAPPAPGGTIITEISPTGTLLSGTGITGGLNGPIAIAFDKGGNAWVANQIGNSLSVFDASGTAVVGTPFKNAGVVNSSSVAVDGDNHVWIANFYETVGIAEYDAATRTPISPSTSFYSGFYTGSITTEVGAVAVDASGNVWMASFTTDSVNELVGAGAPTVQPIVLATKNGTIGTRP
jgi:hypothetical protein